MYNNVEKRFKTFIALSSSFFSFFSFLSMYIYDHHFSLSFFSIYVISFRDYFSKTDHNSSDWWFFRISICRYINFCILLSSLMITSVIITWVKTPPQHAKNNEQRLRWPRAGHRPSSIVRTLQLDLDRKNHCYHSFITIFFSILNLDLSFDKVWFYFFQMK